MAEIVAHPESGKPAVVETSYREIELEAERNKLSELQAQLDADRQAAEEASNKLAASESAVAEQKSLVEGAEAIQPEPQPQTEGVDGDGQAETQAEDSVESGDQPSGDGESVEVPVTVEDPASEY